MRKRPESSRTLKNKTYNQLGAGGIRLNPNSDADGDGVKNKDDCRPLNAQEQGIIHDLKMSFLKKQEQRAEVKRLKLEAKAEKIREELELKKSIHGKKLSGQQKLLAQKQAVINERNQENQRIQKIKDDTKQLKLELEKFTLTGKLKRGARFVGKGIAIGIEKAYEQIPPLEVGGK